MGLWLVAAALLAWALGRLFFSYPEPPKPLLCLSAREAALLRAAAEVMYPAGGAIAVSGLEADIPGYVDRYLGVLHPGKRRQVKLLFLLIEQATLLFPGPGPGGWRRFSSQPVESRRVILGGWEESRFFGRRLVFAALRAVLTMGYLGHPGVLRQLRLAPYAFETPVCEADLLYPRIGFDLSTVAYGPEDLTPPSSGVPLPIDGPWHASYAEDGRGGDDG